MGAAPASAGAGTAGCAQTLWRHRNMIGNPRYGRIGLVTLPYYVVFELARPA